MISLERDNPRQVPQVVLMVPQHPFQNGTVLAFTIELHDVNLPNIESRAQGSPVEYWNNNIFQ